MPDPLTPQRPKPGNRQVLRSHPNVDWVAIIANAVAQSASSDLTKAFQVAAFDRVQPCGGHFGKASKALLDATTHSALTSQTQRRLSGPPCNQPILLRFKRKKESAAAIGEVKESMLRCGVREVRQQASADRSHKHHGRG
ncbi:hypothetical protein FNL55_24340 [Tardiphaga sp. vice352]|uniref:hypothetical protein n=1 Tax=unclassified Tardiphaga TaxID=2631404 RepID=UPI001162ABD8|nr:MULTISPECIES: hypothetical protein [unclassified Tardiphaga]QDM18824.1 hypothetical protein FNL53_24880 [Tardiphaga sp. vice278]QDM23817.1 hypothetical protein FIU28_23650 [Tardiphaga sp. vice154]QDM29041.1 hypothetical protein FNL56_25100 [Tardiphaga sp. vice304]QDM34140.1 hypothetical protein FNL55_24340 [Tardiphaga sp. vice352]